MAGYDSRSALIGKIVPSAPAPHIIDRPRVTAQLTEASTRRVTALTAGPGFGKTTALAAWAAHRNCAWYTMSTLDRDPITLARGLLASLTLRVPGLLDSLSPALSTSIDGARGPDAVATEVVEAFVPALAAALHAGLNSDVILVLDELQDLDNASAGMRLVADLCHMAPRRLHVIIASRNDIPFAVERLRLHGQLYLVPAATLGFDGEETAALLESVGDASLRRHAGAVRQLTGGWPAATRLVAEALAASTDRAAFLAGLLSRGESVDLLEDLLDGEASRAPAPLAALLRVGAALDSFNTGLLAALDVPDAGTILGTARRRGIHIIPAPPDGWSALTPTSREYALARLITDPTEVARTRTVAAHWHLARGDLATALRYLTLAEDGPGIVELLESHGAALLAGGHGAIVADALDRIPAALRTATVDLVEGELCQWRGDWDRAVACLSRLVPDYGPAPAAAAWRLGLIYHLRGEPGRAIVFYRRGHADPYGTPGDRALAAAWGSAAAWLSGDVEACRDLAERAGELAEVSQDRRAQAATHTALAMLAALDGDRRSNDMHYLRALDYAEQAGDVLQIIRIRANRGSRFVEEGYFADAVVELDAAIALADLAGFASLHALALGNRGEAVRRLGRLDDAARDFRAALAIQQRVGSKMAAYALTGLATVHGDRGNTAQARAAYEEALALSEPAGDLQGLVPALCGLALVLAPDSPAEADRLVDRALGSRANLAHTAALLAAGWIALGRGDLAAVREHAIAAAGAARPRRDSVAVAESLELLAATESTVDTKRVRLREAEAMWEAMNCPLPLARTRLALLALDGPAATVSAAEIEEVCRRLGARQLADQAAAYGRAAYARDDATERPELRTLGGFEILRRGLAHPQTVWRSAEATRLLKILVARRGARVPRPELTALLAGPSEDSATGAPARPLSAILATLRDILDPDRTYAADRYVAADDDAIWLRREHLDIDVESFLTQAHAALATVDPGAPGSTNVDIAGLAAAESAYLGDFCESDRAASWAQPLRREARTAYVSVVRALARRHAAGGDHDTAMRHLLRLLASEPDDEQAYLALVRELDASGRHSEARRIYRTYAGRMAVLEVEQQPYPDHD